MKITSTGLPAMPAIATQDSAPIAPVRPAALDGAEPQAAELQAALGQLPEIDEAKVAALRDALARGEVRFDAAKLAGLITRYHGAKG